MGREKQVVEEDDGPSDEWLASYADAMTLLLAFFIMMFAFALIDEGKFFDFKVGVTAALGVPDPLTDNTESILANGTGFMPEIPTPEQKEDLEELEEALAEAGVVTVENVEDLVELLRLRFDLAGAGEFVDVGVDDRGVYIRFADYVLFTPGSADVDGVGLDILIVAASVLSTVSNPLEVEGHTDSDPISTARFPSNWELSAARAAGVARWMIDPGGLPDARLTVVGKADTRPIASNGTDEGRRENRRVEIITRVVEMLPSTGSSVDPGLPAPDPGARDIDDPAGAPPDTLGQPSSDPSDSSDPGETADDPPTSLEDLTTIEAIDDNPVGLVPPLG